MRTIKTTVAITAQLAVLITTTLSLSVGLQAPVHAHDHGEHHDHSGHAHSSNGQQSAANGGLFTQTQAQEYTCSMHPNFRSTDPNDRCPICGMELIPVAAGRSRRRFVRWSCQVNAVARALRVGFADALLAQMLGLDG